MLPKTKEDGSSRCWKWGFELLWTVEAHGYSLAKMVYCMLLSKTVDFFFFFLRGCLVVTSLSLFLFLDVEMYSKISACSHWMCLFCFTVPSWSSVMMKMTAETWKKFGECFSPCVAIAPFM